MIALLAIGQSGPAGKAQGPDPIVVMQTTKGTIVMRIFLGLCPQNASSFLDLVSHGFYNGLTFHRVEGWVIQGGDPRGNGTGNFVDPQTGQTRYLRLETNRNLRHNGPGVVAMAHSRSPNSASCQFYITKKAAPALDGQYSIFGGVVQGMDVVYNISIGDRILSARVIDRSDNRPGGPPPGPAPQPGPQETDSGF